LLMIGVVNFQVKSTVAARLIVSPEEPSDAQPHLDSINSRIRGCQPGVRDVQVAQFEADIVLRAENVHAQRRLIHEVDRVSPGGNVMVRKQRSAGKFQIGGNASVALKIPLQTQRIETDAVSGVCRLEDKKYWNSIDRVFKTATQKSREMQVGEDPSVAQSGVENSCVATSAADGMPAASPDLDFAAALVRGGLAGAELR